MQAESTTQLSAEQIPTVRLGCGEDVRVGPSKRQSRAQQRIFAQGYRKRLGAEPDTSEGRRHLQVVEKEPVGGDMQDARAMQLPKPGFSGAIVREHVLRIEFEQRLSAVASAAVPGSGVNTSPLRSRSAERAGSRPLSTGDPRP